ncbi:MAG: hypothetical protein AAF830_08190 [Pseudomonadota bacterium]
MVLAENGDFLMMEVAPSRRLHIGVYGDPSADRVLLFDPGSFGIYADGHQLCVELASRGWHAVALTRAGMYGSDPLPEGQEPLPGFHVHDMERLMDALGWNKKIILAGHSMAGVRVHLSGHLLEHRLRGLMLLDAVCPSLMDTLVWSGWVGWDKALGAAGAFVAGTALGPMVEELHPNALKLEGRPREDKLASVASEAHLLASAAEVAATERRSMDDVIEPALTLPSFFATATPVSQGTTKLVQQYKAAGTWAERIKPRKVGHVSLLAPPAVKELADGADAVWVAGR